MPLELLTIKDLNEFKAELLRELKQLLMKDDYPGKPRRILKSREVRAMLRISQGTLQNLRRNETLQYRKLGGIIYYWYEDVEKLMVRKR
jgi:uncharacterized protein (DUF2267 family)